MRVAAENEERFARVVLANTGLPAPTNPELPAGGFAIFQESVSGAKGQQHTTIVDVGHCLQEQKGAELAEVIVRFMRANP